MAEDVQGCWPLECGGLAVQGERPVAGHTHPHRRPSVGRATTDCLVALHSWHPSARLQGMRAVGHEPDVLAPRDGLLVDTTCCSHLKIYAAEARNGQEALLPTRLWRRTWRGPSWKRRWTWRGPSFMRRRTWRGLSMERRRTARRALAPLRVAVLLEPLDRGCGSAGPRARFDSTRPSTHLAGRKRCSEVRRAAGWRRIRRHS
mmetsp:Transcript_14787/g.31585  ORF Transcript_14787/g.31585 Transcript_14787/m.31585 type:complete len:203 (-) Transcript_14787:133-741(-)